MATDGAPTTDTQFPIPLQLPLSSEDLAAINAHLNTLTPQEMLRWAIVHLPNLAQTTAFGLTGLVALDMISKLVESPTERPPLIFLDTLYHFPETYELVEDVKKRYGVDVHVFKPFSCNTVEDFEQMFGQKFWETDESSYDYLVKVIRLLYGCF
jgi:phosphoadenosine phosphosulfate reductase